MRLRIFNISLQEKIKKFSAFLVILGVSFFFFSPFLKKITNIAQDTHWDQWFYFSHFARRSLLEYHQFPLHSPFLNGGYPIVGFPQDGSLNPILMFLVLWLGEVVGIKIFCFIVYLTGTISMYYLTKSVLGYGYRGAIFSTLSFSLCSWLPAHFYRGHMHHVYFYLIPLLLVFFIKSKERIEYILYSALIAALIFFQGGPIFLTLVLFLFLFACLEVKEENGKRKFDSIYLKRFLIFIFITLLVGAVKLFPLLSVFKDIGARAFDSYQKASENSFYFSSILDALLVKGRLGTKVLDEGLIIEKGPVMFLGLVPAALFLISLIARFKNNLKWIILLLIFVFISLGPNAPIDVFKLLWNLPFFHSMHKPTKYYSFYIFFIISLVAGQFFSLLKGNRFKKLTILFSILLMLYSIGNQLTYWKYVNRDIFPTRKPNFKRNVFFSQARHVCEAGHAQYYFLLKNIGIINPEGIIPIASKVVPKYYSCAFEYQSLMLFNNYAYKNEIYFLRDENRARFILFSPNKIIAQVEMKEPDTLVINQNFSKYWRVNKGVTADHQGLLSVKLPRAGQYTVELRYVMKEFYIGLTITILTLIAIIVILAKRIDTRNHPRLH